MCKYSGRFRQSRPLCFLGEYDAKRLCLAVFFCRSAKRPITQMG